jgi:hypothetical protein
MLAVRVAVPDGNWRGITGLLRRDLQGKARMTEDEMRDLIVRHSDDDVPTDIDEMVDTALSLSELFEEAADDEMQLGLDELVLDAATSLGALDANEAADGDEQDDTIADAESAAADVNNEGIASHAAFVLAKNGLEEGRTKLREILGLPVAPLQ